MAPLKYHILKVYANGVMNERGKFSPFKATSAGLSAKVGVRYYIKSAAVSGQNTGVHAVSTTYIQGIIAHQTSTIIGVKTGVTDAAVVISLGASNTIECGVLCDSNTAITAATDASSATYNIIYAEIDEVEGEYSD